jgi:hypothetical protein
MLHNLRFSLFNMVFISEYYLIWFLYYSHFKYGVCKNFKKSSGAKGLTIIMAEIRLLNSSFCKTGGWPCKYCHWPNNNSPTHKASTVCWISLTFPGCSNSLCLLYTGWGLLCSRIIPHGCSSPLPANSLIQSAWHVTAHVHIHFWISKYEYNADDSCSTE